MYSAVHREVIVTGLSTRQNGLDWPEEEGTVVILKQKDNTWVSTIISSLFTYEETEAQRA